MKIFCKNYECKWNRKLNNPISFWMRKNYYIPFDDDVCYGECFKDKVMINSIDLVDGNVYKRIAYCFNSNEDKHLNTEEKIICLKIDCLHNSKSNKISGFCNRGEILIDKSKVQGEDIWICKCFSLEKISGHMDWSKFLKPDGTAKGGKIDDDYAEKIYKDSLKAKSYRTHLRPAKEIRKRGR